MSDLICREALEEALLLDVLIKGELNYNQVKDLITNAPAIEQGEAVAKVLFRQDEDGLEPISFYSNYEYPKKEELKDSFVMMDVYLSQQQPQEKDELVNKAFAEALEEAAKICDDYANSNFGSLVDSGQNGAYVCSKAIRALIKRNALVDSICNKYKDESL